MAKKNARKPNNKPRNLAPGKKVGAIKTLSGKRQHSPI